jgi:hypothetical protein
MDRREIHEVHAVGNVVEQLGRHLEAQAGLANATGASQRQQARIRLMQQRADLCQLARAPDQRGGLRRQVGAPRVQGVERGKGRWQVGSDELKDLIGQAEVFEPLRAQIAQRRVERELLAHQLLSGEREQDLAAVPGIQEPRRAVERRPEVIVTSHLGTARVQRHAHPQWFRQRPRLYDECALGGQRGCQRVRRLGEGREDAIADGLEDHAPVRGDALLHQGIVAGERGRHRVRMSLPQLRAAFDVGEQKRDRSLRQRHHGLLERLGGQRQSVHRPFSTCNLDKGHSLRCVEAEAVGQALGKLARRSPRIGLDLLDQIERAADSLREFCLGQVERLAPPPQPVAERVRVIHPPSCTGSRHPLVSRRR